MANPKLVDRAVAILQREDRSGNADIWDAIDILNNSDLADDVDPEAIEKIAEAALEKRRTAPAPRVQPQPARQQQGRGGHGQRAGGHNPAGGGATRGPRQRNEVDQELVTAPYRFVTVNEKVVEAPADVREAMVGLPLANGFCGAIEVEWAFETPMLIGEARREGQDEVSGPLKVNGAYVIPGATFRGAMRAAFGVVTRSRLSQVNTNHRYGVRDFDHPLFGESGNRRLAWDNLKGGFLQANGKTWPDGTPQYELTECDRRIIRIRAMPQRLNGNRSTDDGDWHLSWLRKDLAARYALLGYVNGGTDRTPLFDFSDDRAKHFARDSGAGSNDPTVSDWVVEGQGGRKGWFVVSNTSPSLRDASPSKLDQQDRNPGKGDFKKRECVFLEKPNAKTVILRQEVFEEFERINSKPGKTKLQPDGSYKVMKPTLEAGRRIPVFYVGDLAADDRGVQTSLSANGFALGLTRLFKLPHTHSVGQVLARWDAHPVVKVDANGKRVRNATDMTEALFGHVFDREDLGLEKDESVDPGIVARKGRIAFGFGKLLNPASEVAESEKLTTIAMAPRASYAPFYLQGPVKDWTDQAIDTRQSGKARLAGRKRYFARFSSSSRNVAAQKIAETLLDRDNPQAGDSRSHLRLLKPARAGGELRFASEMRLHNAVAEEIGALLWTLTHGGDPAKPFRHMMGRAKNAGAGQARIKSIRIKLKANLGGETHAMLTASPEDWETQGAEGWLAEGSQSMAPFLRAFEIFMREHTGEKTWPQGAADIEEFLGVSDPAEGAKIASNGKDKFISEEDRRTGRIVSSPGKHGNLRRTVNASHKNDPAPGTPFKLLQTPRVKVKQPI